MIHDLPERPPRPHCLLAVLACAATLLVACSDEASTAASDIGGDAASDADVAADLGDADADDAATETGDLVDAPSDTAGDTAEEAEMTVSGLRVTTLNLRCLIDGWEDRLPIIVDALASLDPDLMGFQEVCDEPGADNLDELLTALALETGRDYEVERFVTHRAWDRYDEGIAVASALPIGDASSVVLPAGVFTRRIVMVRVSTELGSVVFSTTHFDHQSEVARARQAAAVVDALDELGEPGEIRLLTGDLNEGPDDGSVASTLSDAGFVDTWAALAEDGDSGFTMPASAPTARIDYVWLDAGDSDAEAIEAAVFVDEPVGGIYGSDHLGVTSVIGR